MHNVQGLSLEWDTHAHFMEPYKDSTTNLFICFILHSVNSTSDFSEFVHDKKWSIR